MNETKLKSGRRNFLLAAGLGGAGAAAVLAVKSVKTAVPDAPAVAARAAAPGPKGYHVTAHVTQYYKTTEI
jgi:hypothetical protein